MSTRPENIDYELLSRYLTGNADNPEKREVEAWIRESSENRKVMEDMRLLWQKPEVTESVDVDQAWKNVKGRMNTDTAVPIIRKLTPQPIIWAYRIAAILVVAIGFAWLFNNYYGSTGNEISMEAGTENALANLTDGTFVTVAAGSKLTYPKNFKGNTREVTLEGEAFFKVAHDEEKPFIIHADETEIRVLGTSFNVNIIDSADVIEVIVETGKIRFSVAYEPEKDSSFVILEAGFKGIYNIVTGEFNRIANDDISYSFWMDRKLVFKAIELSNVVEILNELYNVSIELKGNSIDECQFSGTFNDESIDSILDILSATFSLDILRNNEVIELSGEGCQ